MTTQPETPPGGDERYYLIYSREHNAWWRPNGAGYCNKTEDAGRYTYSDAIARCNSRSVDDPDYPAEVLAACPDAMRALQDELDGANLQLDSEQQDHARAMDRLTDALKTVYAIRGEDSEIARIINEALPNG
jgi:hypothetical protein